MVKLFTQSDVKKVLDQISTLYNDTLANKTVLYGFESLVGINAVSDNIYIYDSTATLHSFIAHITSLPYYYQPRCILIFFNKDKFGTEIKGLYEIIYTYKVIETICESRKINLFWYTDNTLVRGIYKRQRWFGRIFNDNTITCDINKSTQEIFNIFFTNHNVMIS